MREGEYFKPGDKVVRSGIYNVTHGGGHMPDHPVTCMFGKHFPKCDDCDDAARFTLILSIAPSAEKLIRRPKL